MATELVIKSWCDVCLSVGTNTPGETLNVPTIGAVAAFDVEVCPRHAKPLAEAVAALAEHGRKPGTGVPKTPAVKPHKGRADDKPGRFACPTCKAAGNVREARSLGALRLHLREGHGQSLADVGLAKTRATCPECGSKFSNGQGLSAHVRTAHPAADARAKESA